MVSRQATSFGRQLLAGLIACVAIGCGDEPTANSDVGSVEISPPVAELYVGTAIPMTATVKDDAGSVVAGRAVVWTTSNGDVATVSPTGLVTAHRLGTAQIAASAGGESGISTVTVSAVPIVSVVVEPPVVSLTVGQTRPLAAVVRDETGAIVAGAAVSWTTSANGIAFVSQSGVVTAAAPGNATITASSGGRSGTATVSVTPVPPAPVASVTISPPSATLNTGETRQLAVTVRDAGGNVLTGRPVSWSSSNGAVASVNQSGLVSALVPGSATITANVQGVPGTSSITVQLVVLPVARVEVSPANATVEENDDIQLTARVFDALGRELTGRQVTWSTSDNKICTVNAQGRVEGKQEGTCVITATSEGKTGTSTIRVEDD